jgi:hypothetical protein
MRALIFILICSSTSIFSQPLHDIVWLTGYGHLGYPPNGLVVGGSILDFKNGGPDISTVSLATQDVVGIISDRQGNLVAYSDGCKIANKNHHIMLNGDSLSPGKIFNDWCIDSEYPTFQGCIFLPQPGSDNKYYLFHVRCVGLELLPYELLYSVVDATGNGGAGKVVAKNQLAWADSTLNSYITATRHANGRDWWIVNPRRTSSGFHVGLLTPEGFQDKGIQSIGVDTLRDHYCCGQASFSPDGSKYFKHIPTYGVEVLDFDRCTGQFSNPVELDLSAENNGGGGVAAAPGSRYLYVTTGRYIYQYDLWASDLAASRDTVAVWDGYMSPYSTGFYQPALARDGKLYIVTASTNNVLHIIHHPDSAGIACQVEQHGLTVPTLTGWFAPNFPNYKLGALAGSLCDSIPADTTATAVQIPVSRENFLLVYPNPASSEIHFDKFYESGGQNGVLQLFDPKGTLIEERIFHASEFSLTLPVSCLPAGVYFWEITWEDGKQQRGKIQKI